jgi:hypothetical protein
VLHEALGHGGACLAVGGRVLLISTVNMECSADHRLVTAGGTLMNFAAAALCVALLRAASPHNVLRKYFLWFLGTVNLLAATGYFLFSGVGGFGDWASFIQGLGPQLPWRIGLATFGAAAYLLAVRLSLRELRPLIGSDKHLRYRRAVELTRWPYFAGGTAACIAGSLNPAGMILVALSAAASTFGGCSGLLWGPEWLKGSGIPLGDAPEASPIPRSWPWIGAATLCACLWTVLLGPGLRLSKS